MATGGDPTITMATGAWNSASPAGARSAAGLLHAKNIRRPQLDFEGKVDNSEQPFMPSLPTKPHATVAPLDLSLVTPEASGGMGEDSAVDGEDAGDVRQYVAHPYRGEILAWTPSVAQLAMRDECMYQALDKVGDDKTHTHIHIYTHAHTYIHASACICIRKYTHKHTHIYVYINTYICIYMCVYICIFIHIFF